MNFIPNDQLFQDPPPKKDCPICMLPIPYASEVCEVGTAYMPCCGKILCCGCMHAAQGEMKKGNMKQCCAFCRVPHPRSAGEAIKRLKKRMKLGDPEAFYTLGGLTVMVIWVYQWM